MSQVAGMTRGCSTIAGLGGGGPTGAAPVAEGRSDMAQGRGGGGVGPKWLQRRGDRWVTRGRQQAREAAGGEVWRLCGALCGTHEAGLPEARGARRKSWQGHLEALTSARAPH
jgi:hypothetical protein